MAPVPAIVTTALVAASIRLTRPDWPTNALPSLSTTIERGEESWTSVVIVPAAACDVRDRATITTTPRTRATIKGMPTAGLRRAKDPCFDKGRLPPLSVHVRQQPCTIRRGAMTRQDTAHPNGRSAPPRDPA